MNKKVILFDLDGTLLPMNARLFEKTYFRLLVKYMSNYGYNPKQLLNVLIKGVDMMVANDGIKTNEEVFRDTFVSVYGKNVLKDMAYFDAFYRDHFDEIQSTCGYLKDANNTIKFLKEKGFRLALTTNPVFPAIATHKRINWAGLDINDFEIVTTYENYHYCKPNSKYFQEVIDNLGVRAEDCIMVGNDMVEDLCAEELGIQVFMITHSLINSTNKDVSEYPNGSLKDFLDYIENLN